MVKGYYYTDEQAAIDAVVTCDTYYGCPNEATEHWCAYQEWGDGWAIIADESLVVVLGQAVDLPIIEEDEIQ
jgi:hypothetical protein